MFANLRFGEKVVSFYPVSSSSVTRFIPTWKVEYCSSATEQLVAALAVSEAILDIKQSFIIGALHSHVKLKKYMM